jgi:hypothetical protein
MSIYSLAGIWQIMSATPGEWRDASEHVVIIAVAFVGGYTAARALCLLRPAFTGIALVETAQYQPE